jgi:hypothetical protein
MDCKFLEKKLDTLKEKDTGARAVTEKGSRAANTWEQGGKQTLGRPVTALKQTHSCKHRRAKPAIPPKTLLLPPHAFQPSTHFLGYHMSPKIGKYPSPGASHLNGKP